MFAKLLWTLPLLFSLTVNADVVILDNGDRISGTVISKTGSHLLFKTGYAGNIRINWKNISTIKIKKPVQVMLKNKTTIEQANIDSPASKQIEINSTNISNPVNVAMEEILYINPPVEVSGKGIKVKGRVNAGLSIASGNSENESYNLDAEVIIRSKDNRFTVGGKLYRASDESVDTEDKTSVYLKYDHFLSQKRYIYGHTSFARDRFKDQKLKSTIGAGYGHQFFESDDRNMSLEAGINYVNDDFYITEDTDYIAGRWALKYDNWFYQKKLQFFHQHEGLIDFDNTDNLNINTQTGLRFPFLSGMNASIQLNADWDGDTPIGTKSTDRKLLFNLGYTW